MKIEFIGTGSIGAKELSACTLIDSEILIDMPNGSIKRLKQTGHNVLDIKNCFITHLHGDHFFDIPFFMMERLFYLAENEANIYGPIGIKERVLKLLEVGFPTSVEKILNGSKVNFIEFDELQGVEFLQDNYITSLLVDHGDLKPAYGYILERENKKIGFSGDSKYCESIIKIIEESDISVLDMSFMDSRTGHMGLEDIKKISEKYTDKTIVTTHMQDYTREQAKQCNMNNVIIPEDGKVINLT